MDYANIGKQYSGYVRFIRGTPTAWNNLEKKDDNTLYFISEKGANSGLLYLGSKLISGSGEINIQSNTSLSKLKDVALNLNIQDGSVLTFDKKTGKWVDKVFEIKIPEIEIPEVNIDVFKGATKYMAGKEGLVPAPFEGQEKYYLQGDGSWSNPTEALEVELLLLRGQDETGSIRSIAANEILKIFGTNVPEKYNTIEKIANWIVENGTSVDSAEGARKLEELEKAVYGDDKTSQTNGLIAVTSSLQEIINGSANTEGLKTTVHRLDIDNVVIKNDISQLKQQYKTLNSTVTNLSERLRWQNV